jgi:pimeloyl-ACP methyl ester carboxylesterase
MDHRCCSHGGPTLGAEYLAPLVDELDDGYRVAWYQQRGLAPRTAQEPFDVDVQAEDVTLVLDALGWDRAFVVGHSWGGHLLLHVLASHPDRLSGAVVVDPLGGVGDGGAEAFGAELTRRMALENKPRFDELNEREKSGETLSDSERQDVLAMVWPGYFARPDQAPDMPHTRVGVQGHYATWSSIRAALPSLPERLRSVTVPTVFVHGGLSPIPLTASTDTADVIGPSASVVVVPGTGHFTWHESPGVVRRALDDLLARTNA